MRQLILAPRNERSNRAEQLVARKRCLQKLGKRSALYSWRRVDETYMIRPLGVLPKCQPPDRGLAMAMVLTPRCSSTLCHPSFGGGCQETCPVSFERPTTGVQSYSTVGAVQKARLRSKSATVQASRGQIRARIQKRNGYYVDREKNTHRALPIHRSVLLLTPASVLVPDALNTVAPTNSNAVTEANQRSPPSLLLTAAHNMV